MKLSTRVRYGVRAMIELAQHPQGDTVALSELAARQQISPKYLEPLMLALKSAGLVASVLGKSGGYQLARPAADITVYDIYRVLDTSPDLMACEHQCEDEPGACPRLARCAARRVWAELDQAITDYLQGQNLRMLADREKRLQRKRGE